MGEGFAAGPGGTEHLTVGIRVLRVISTVSGGAQRRDLRQHHDLSDPPVQLSARSSTETTRDRIRKKRRHSGTDDRRPIRRARQEPKLNACPLPPTTGACAVVRTRTRLIGPMGRIGHIGHCGAWYAHQAVVRHHRALLSYRSYFS